MTTPTPLRIHPFGPLREGDREVIDTLTNEVKKGIAISSCLSTNYNAVVHPMVLQLQADWLAGKYDKP